MKAVKAMKAMPLLLAGTLVGCGLVATERADEPDPKAPMKDAKARYERELAEIEAEKRGSEWLEVCEGGRRARCGLVFDEINEPKRVRRFVKKVCEEKVKVLDEASKACRRKFRKMFLTRVVERYVEVDPAALTSHCDGHPEECKDPRGIELWMLNAHNDAVQERYRVRKLDARNRFSDEFRAAVAHEEVQREREDEQARQELARSLDRLLGIEEPVPDETCVTEHVGEGVAETNCIKRD